MSRAKDTDFYRLKAAMSDLMARCGGLARSAALVGLSTAMMGKVNDREDVAFLSIDAKLRLERECGAPLVTAVEADLIGCRLERNGPMPTAPDGCALSAHAAVMQEVGDLCSAFAHAQRDGRYSRTDAATVGRELAELRRAIESFERVHAAVMAGGAA
ncbi:hypothetical protein LJR090_002531 [Bosea sp. LjRoot90]|uniref:hypothetical protein n=1 Tax=Bosea sp. LjRoot90 TaxID=3342342 RepID=UPI003ECC301E